MPGFLVFQLHRAYLTRQSNIRGGMQMRWSAWALTVSSFTLSLAVSMTEQIYVLEFSISLLLKIRLFFFLIVQLTVAAKRFFLALEKLLFLSKGQEV